MPRCSSLSNSSKPLGWKTPKSTFSFLASQSLTPYLKWLVGHFQLIVVFSQQIQQNLDPFSSYQPLHSFSDLLVNSLQLSQPVILPKRFATFLQSSFVCLFVCFTSMLLPNSFFYLECHLSLSSSLKNFTYTLRITLRFPSVEPIFLPAFGKTKVLDLPGHWEYP